MRQDLPGKTCERMGKALCSGDFRPLALEPNRILI